MNAANSQNPGDPPGKPKMSSLMTGISTNFQVIVENLFRELPKRNRLRETLRQTRTENHEQHPTTLKHQHRSSNPIDAPTTSTAVHLSHESTTNKRPSKQITSHDNYDSLRSHYASARIPKKTPANPKIQPINHNDQSNTPGHVKESPRRRSRSQAAGDTVSTETDRRFPAEVD